MISENHFESYSHQIDRKTSAFALCSKRIFQYTYTKNIEWIINHEHKVVLYFHSQLNTKN